MGTYDVPAALTTVLDVSGKQKATLIGYSQGSAQIWYALAKHQDFYADKVHRFVALASCIISKAGDSSPSDVAKYYWYLDQKGIYNYFGDDESSKTMAEIDCIAEGKRCGEETTLELSSLPIASYLYYD